MTGSEVMFLLIIGLVVLGPEKLPDAIRRVGKLYAELKRMSSGVQTDFRKVMDEPLKEMMNTTNSMKALFTDTASEFESAAKEIVEPTFIPYSAADADAQAQDSEQSDSDQDDDTDIAEGIANAAKIAQQRKDDAAKFKFKPSSAKITKPKPKKSTTKNPAKKPVKKTATMKTTNKTVKKKTVTKTSAAKKPQSKKSKG